MKKNYFYTTIAQEFSLLLATLDPKGETEVHDAYRRCLDCHKTLSLHLFRDFITPADRGDLYSLSLGILEVFPTLFSLPLSEKSKILPSVRLLSATPFRFDESALQRRTDFLALWQPVPAPGSSLFPTYNALNHLSQVLVLMALKNA